MTVSRRGLLRAGAVVLSGIAAGCPHDISRSHATLSVSVDKPFGTDPPVEVPITVDVRIASLRSREAGVSDLAVVALDGDRAELAAAELGTHTYEGAGADDRTILTPSENRDDPYFVLETSFSRTLTSGAVPDWLSIRASEIRANPDDRNTGTAYRERDDGGEAPPPPVKLVSKRYLGGQPIPETVDPSDYDAVMRYYTFGRPNLYGEPAMLPAPTATPSPGIADFWHPYEGPRREQLAHAVEAFDKASRHAVALEAREDLEASLLETRERSHLFVAPHDWADEDLDGVLVEHDQHKPLAVNLDGAFVQPTPDAGRVEDRTVGVPFAAATVALLYNRDLVERPPATLSELRSAAARHHDPDNGTYGLGHALSPFYLSGWVHAFDGYYYDPETDELGLTDRRTIRGLQVVLDDLDPTMPPESSAGFDPFEEGKAAFVVAGPRTHKYFREAGVDVGVTTLPTVDGREPVPHVSVSTLFFTEEIGGWSYEQERASTAARSFAAWYATNDRLLSRQAEETGLVPVSRSVLEGDVPQATEVFAQAVANGRLRPASTRFDHASRNLFSAVREVARGEADLEPALATAERDLREAWEG